MVCNDVFLTKVERNNHFCRTCQAFIRLMDLEGNIKQIGRTNGKFVCPLCPRVFSHSNNLISHWGTCKTRDGTESNSHYLIDSNYVVDLDKDDAYTEYLRYDGTYKLAVCVDCGYALPLEWIA